MERARVDRACNYCGARACWWHAQLACCNSPRCTVLHAWATHEPRLWLPPSEPTLWQRARALLAYGFFRALATAIPIDWVLGDQSTKRWLAVWCHGNQYAWWERMHGRL